MASTTTSGPCVAVYDEFAEWFAAIADAGNPGAARAAAIALVRPTIADMDATDPAWWDRQDWKLYVNSTDAAAAATTNQDSPTQVVLTGCMRKERIICDYEGYDSEDDDST